MPKSTLAYMSMKVTWSRKLPTIIRYDAGDRADESYSYVVVVKVGKPSETLRPGNRGKRDSQVMLLNYLNRVHFDAPMSPLELEIYHQMRNVIGIDPAFYEYIFQVDADTVSPQQIAPSGKRGLS